MAIGRPRKRSASLRVGLMLFGLVVAAFLGAALGLVWQQSGWFEEETQDELVTVEAPGG
ncbi:hypothetical protein [Aurantiacibacter hainanensis]|uniref:hypothetical protein n=1 Tax=Aurantiacibacter hainanensis TaxID=3076114 RepID=UPI0030C6A683